MSDLFIPDNYRLIPNCACGRNDWRDGLVADAILGVSIKPACCIHDFMYTFPKDAGEEYREHADRVFLNNMLRLIKDGGGNWLLRNARRGVAYTYFAGVRAFGGPSFWSDKNPAKNRLAATDWVNKAQSLGLLEKAID